MDNLYNILYNLAESNLENNKKLAKLDGDTNCSLYERIFNALKTTIELEQSMYSKLEEKELISIKNVINKYEIDSDYISNLDGAFSSPKDDYLIKKHIINNVDIYLNRIQRDNMMDNLALESDINKFFMLLDSLNANLEYQIRIDILNSLIVLINENKNKDLIEIKYRLLFIYNNLINSINNSEIIWYSNYIASKTYTEYNINKMEKLYFNIMFNYALYNLAYSFDNNDLIYKLLIEVSSYYLNEEEQQDVLEELYNFRNVESININKKNLESVIKIVEQSNINKSKVKIISAIK